MKYVFLCAVMVFSFSTKSFADFYECTAVVGEAVGFTHLVDTSTNFEYEWFFPTYRDVRHSCGVEVGSDKLKCILRTESKGAETIYSIGEIQSGDKYLFVSSPVCEKNLGCSIRCALAPDPSRLVDEHYRF